LVVMTVAPSEDQEEDGTDDEETCHAADNPDPDRRRTASRPEPLAQANVEVVLVLVIRVGTAARPARRIFLVLVSTCAFASATPSAGFFLVGARHLAAGNAEDGLAGGTADSAA